MIRVPLIDEAGRLLTVDTLGEEALQEPGGRGTSVHVWFAINALYSSCIVVSQWGLRIAVHTLFGIGEGEGVAIARLASA